MVWLEILGFTLTYIGSYTLQIFWKGDPGVENFIIKHTNEERLDQWSKMLQKQRETFSRAGTPGSRGGRTSGGRSTATTEFAWMVNTDSTDQATTAELSEDEEDAEDTADAPLQNGSLHSGFNMPRNGSNSSLRSRSGTNESLQLQQPQPPLGAFPGTYARPNQRYPQPGGSSQPPLTLVTGVSPMSQIHDASYFSPVTETPMSTRVSSSSSQFPFPRTSTPGYVEENRRFTPPSGFTPPNMSRSTSREGAAIAASQAQFAHHSQVQATNRLQRPSLPGMGPPPVGTHQQNRMRSASSPNIHHLPSQAQLARSPGGPIPPMPTLPSSYVAYSGGPAVINRSQNSSPTSPGLPIQGTPARNDSPVLPENGPRYNGINGGSSVAQAQVKLKVNYGNDKFVIIVPYNIPYLQLMDRIERKVKICGTGSEVPGNPIRIKYQDEDGDFILMNSDDDVLMAFDVFGEPGRNDGSGITGVVTLYVSVSVS